MAPYTAGVEQVSSDSPRPQDRFFRPSQQLVLRLKSPAAVRPVAVEGQVEFQAVWQKLHGTCELLGAVAEGPEHGGGVSAQGASAICGDETLELLEPVKDDDDSLG